jgi:hypothetical protein
MQGLSFYKSVLSPTDITALLAGKTLLGSISYVKRTLKTVWLKSMEISGCSAEQREGGGLLAHSGGLLTLQDVVITNNKAERGGGICVLGHVEGLTPVLINNSVISHNKAAEGAGVYFEDGSFDPLVRTEHVKYKMLISGSDFAGNVAEKAGGGLQLSQLKDDWSVHTHAGQELLGWEDYDNVEKDPDVEFDYEMSWYGRWTISKDSKYIYAT